MSLRAPGSSIELPRLLAVDSARAHDLREIEGEVLALFDTHRDALLRYVSGFGISVADAEDVVQDVFVALFRHLCRSGARTNLRGWLFQVAHNVGLKHRAERRRDQQRFGGADGHRVLDPHGSPEEVLAARERSARIRAVLKSLPQRDRHCVQLRGHGFRYREIADVLGISLGGVANALTRSVSRLQRALEG